MCYLLLFYCNKELPDCVKAKGFIVVSSGQPSLTKVSNSSLCELSKLSIHLWIAEAEEDNPSTLYTIFVYFDASVNEALGIVYTEWQCTCYDDAVISLAVHIPKALALRCLQEQD